MTEPQPVRHGLSAYNKKRCRCAVCKAANTEHHRKARAKRYERTRLNGGVAPIEKHGIKTAQNWGCSCPTCSGEIRDMNIGYRGKYKETHARHNARTLNRKQAETLEGATRWGQVWTGPELELAMREDLTAKEVALALRRSYHAVVQARKRIHAGEPKFVALLGAPRKEGAA